MKSISFPNGYGDIYVYDVNDNHIATFCIDALAGEKFSVAKYTKADLDLDYSYLFPVSSDEFSAYSNLGDVTIDITGVNENGTEVTSATITVEVGEKTYIIKK